MKWKSNQPTRKPHQSYYIKVVKVNEPIRPRDPNTTPRQRGRGQNKTTRSTTTRKTTTRSQNHKPTTRNDNTPDANKWLNISLKKKSPNVSKFKDSPSVWALPEWLAKDENKRWQQPSNSLLFHLFRKYFTWHFFITVFLRIWGTYLRYVSDSILFWRIQVRIWFNFILTYFDVFWLVFIFVDYFQDLFK